LQNILRRGKIFFKSLKDILLSISNYLVLSRFILREIIFLII